MKQLREHIYRNSKNIPVSAPKIVFGGRVLKWAMDGEKIRRELIRYFKRFDI